MVGGCVFPSFHPLPARVLYSIITSRTTYPQSKRGTSPTNPHYFQFFRYTRHSVIAEPLWQKPKLYLILPTLQYCFFCVCFHFDNFRKKGKNVCLFPFPLRALRRHGPPPSFRYGRPSSPGNGRPSSSGDGWSATPGSPPQQQSPGAARHGPPPRTTDDEWRRQRQRIFPRRATWDAGRRASGYARWQGSTTGNG